MAEIEIDDPLFDYQAYRYGRSRQIFRGPKPDMGRAYLSFIGSAHTFGRYVDMPYPQILAKQFEMPVLNLGTDGAGPGFFLGDP